MLYCICVPFYWGTHMYKKAQVSQLSTAHKGPVAQLPFFCARWTLSVIIRHFGISRSQGISVSDRSWSGMQRHSYACDFRLLFRLAVREHTVICSEYRRQ